MDQEIKDRWKKALNSGEYEKTTGALKRRPYASKKYAFCCLGVLTDLYSLEKKVHWEKVEGGVGRGEYFKMHGQYGALPTEVKEWAGLPHVSPTVGNESLVSLNDSNCLTFKEIAKEIDKYL